VDRVRIDVSYATRLFSRERHHLDGDAAVLFAATPPRDRRVGFMLAVEGDRWMVTLGGMLGEPAPTTEAAFEACAMRLPRRDIYDVICHATPLGGIARFHFGESRRTRFERMRRFPDRYLVLGDAWCSVNPVYGQGMTIAALEALALRSCLAESAAVDGLWRRIAPRLSRIVARAWQLSVQGDLAYPEVSEPRRGFVAWAHWHVANVHRAAGADPIVCRAFFDVANLLVPPSRLVQPRIWARMAWLLISKKWGTVARRVRRDNGPERGHRS
jgi:2-polyprenyl-6-methoxyphenol hydroxylase-like FAD-dependent oxidoreductase